MAALMAWLLRPTTVAMAASLLTMVSHALVAPYTQARRDALGCGLTCNGNMLSVSSALKLVGSPLCGRLSDQQGRRLALFVSAIGSAISFAILGFTHSLTGLWLSLVPQSLFNHAFNINKAVIVDFTKSSEERAAELGKLSMAAGLGMVAGPALGMAFISTHEQAAAAAVLFSILAVLLAALLPAIISPDEPSSSSSAAAAAAPSTPSSSSSAAAAPSSSSSSAAAPASEVPAAPVENTDASKLKNGSSHGALNGHASASGGSVLRAVRRQVAEVVALNRGCQVLMLFRFSMSLGFFLFHAAFTVSVKERFDLSAREQSFFMAYVGLTYALSQYFVAKPVIRLYGEQPITPMLACIVALAAGRYIAYITTLLPVMLAAMGLVVVAIGVMNTTISTITSKAVPADQIGGLYGLMQAVENVAGLVGPSAGGYLGEVHRYAPLVTVQLLYMAMALMLITLFRARVMPLVRAAAKEKSS